MVSCSIDRRKRPSGRTGTKGGPDNWFHPIKPGRLWASPITLYNLHLRKTFTTAQTIRLGRRPSACSRTPGSAFLFFRPATRPQRMLLEEGLVIRGTGWRRPSSVSGELNKGPTNSDRQNCNRDYCKCRMNHGKVRPGDLAIF